MIRLHRASQRGAALMAVLMAAIGLSVTLILVLSLSMRRAQSARHGIERMRSIYGGESGYRTASARLVDNPQLAGEFDLTFPGQPQDIQVHVTVEDLLDGAGNPSGQKRVTSHVDYVTP